MRRVVLEAERAEIIRLRNTGEITDPIMRRIERDLDLEDARLDDWSRRYGSRAAASRSR